MVCFVHFHLEMCFAPQRRALFRHRNFQKCSEPLVFCTFWLGFVLRATTACNFSSLIWPAGSAPAALASLLFDPPEPQIIGKTQCFATFLPSMNSGLSTAIGTAFLHGIATMNLCGCDMMDSKSSEAGMVSFTTRVLTLWTVALGGHTLYCISLQQTFHLKQELQSPRCTRIFRLKACCW